MKRDKIQHLIVDSGAFIKNAPLHEYGENILTAPNVFKEIKDKATLQRLQFLPYQLTFRQPSQEIIKHVTEFSKKTGDYPSLSAVDIQIIALTYQLEKEHVGTDHLRKEPAPGMITGHSVNISGSFAGFYYPKEGSEEASEDPNAKDAETNEITSSDSTDNATESYPEKTSGDVSTISNSIDESGEDASSSGEECEHDSDVPDENEEDSDSEGWITPSNVDEVKQKMGVMSLTDEKASPVVACITTDFAVQNVLLQMGLNIISVDGMLIKRTKVFILRCYACYRTTNIMTKQFCPGCGNKTLKRVAVSINEDGTKKIHINFKRPINIRGTKYSLPMPRGGKHAMNPILCEDQPVPHNRPSKAALAKVDTFSPEYEALTSPFAMTDIYSRAAQLGIRNQKGSHFSRRNPNEPVKRFGKKKRK